MKIKKVMFVLVGMWVCLVYLCENGVVIEFFYEEGMVRVCFDDGDEILVFLEDFFWLDLIFFNKLLVKVKFVLGK